MSSFDVITSDELLNRLNFLVSSLNDECKKLAPFIKRIADLREESEVIKIELQKRGELKQDEKLVEKS